MATLVQDDFNRADSATVPGGPVTGSAPTVLVGTWGISSNQLYCATLSSTRGLIVWDPGTVDVDVEVTFTTPGNFGGVAVGAVSATDFIGVGWVVNTTEGVMNVGLTRNYSSGSSQPDVMHKVAVLNTSALVSPLTLRVEIKSGMCKISINGSQVGQTFKVPLVYTNTRCGVWTNSTTTRIDNLTIQDSTSLGALPSRTGHAYKGRPLMSADAGASE